MTTPEFKPLLLPKNSYGPLCLHILNEFIDHHKLSKGLPTPEAGLEFNVAMSRIFDIMVHSMGKEKRKEILKNVEEYNMSLPAAVRP